MNCLRFAGHFMIRFQSVDEEIKRVFLEFEKKQFFRRREVDIVAAFRLFSGRTRVAEERQ